MGVLDFDLVESFFHLDIINVHKFVSSAFFIFDTREDEESIFGFINTKVENLRADLVIFINLIYFIGQALALNLLYDRMLNFFAINLNGIGVQKHKAVFTDELVVWDIWPNLFKVTNISSFMVTELSSPWKQPFAMENIYDELFVEVYGVIIWRISHMEECHLLVIHGLQTIG